METIKENTATSGLLSLVGTTIRESIAAKEALLGDQRLLQMIVHVGGEITRCFQSGGRVYIFGNGGSATDAEHIAAEFAGRYERHRPGLPCIALTTNTASLTAISNDYSFDSVFARQLEGWAHPGDVAIGISTSGNSANVVRGLEYAKSMKVITVALTGKSGGKLKETADYCLCVPSERTARIQEAHILLGHVLCEIVDQP